MAADGKGSIILKILIVLLFVVLWQAITIPEKIWEEEDSATRDSRNNMATLYEAERYYHDKTKSYLPADSLEQLLAFVRTDSSLLQRRKVGEMTNLLYDKINNIMDVPAINSILPVSESIDELVGDLRYNARFFDKPDYEQYDLQGQAARIQQDLAKFDASTEFENFNTVKVYVDSLDILRDEINEHSLSSSVAAAISYADTLTAYLESVEKQAVESFWNDLYARINQMILSIRQTDIGAQSSVAERFERFIERINTSMQAFQASSFQQNAQQIQQHRSDLATIEQQFAGADNLAVAQRNGILQLSESDSILIKFDEENFTCPDSYGASEPLRYLVSYGEGAASLVVESPNLMPQFQQDLLDATRPVADLGIYNDVAAIREVMDSTLATMDDVKDRYRLSRLDRSGQLILDLKELQAEMTEEQLETVFFYRFTKRIKEFTELVQEEQKLSVLKPAIEDVLFPMDSLAAMMEKRDLGELEEKLNYYRVKLARLDSLIGTKVSARVASNIPSFAAEFQPAMEKLNSMKSSLSAADAQKLRSASDQIEELAEQVINGREDAVYGVFTQKHINHGYVSISGKSWEQEE